MNKSPVLVVMAAGMGSRYGGLKQIDPVGCAGEAILDYSLYDAYEAGFRRAIIVIKEAIREDFMSTVGKRLERSPMEIIYAYQELDKIPAGCTIPEGRTKPWGTGHAIACAAEGVGDAPFGVINADDYYGKAAFRTLYEQLLKLQEGPVIDCCMVSYLLKNTVSDNGTVARGVCSMDANGCLSKLTERTKIAKREGGIAFTEDGEHWEPLHEDTLVSMNMFGFSPGLLEEMKARMSDFFRDEVPPNPMKAEYQLPTVVSQLMAEGKAQVKLLSTPSKWYGVTYAADKPLIQAAILQKTQEGEYPEGLWK